MEEYDRGSPVYTSILSNTPSPIAKVVKRANRPPALLSRYDAWTRTLFTYLHSMTNQAGVGQNK